MRLPDVPNGPILGALRARLLALYRLGAHEYARAQPRYLTLMGELHLVYEALGVMLHERHVRRGSGWRSCIRYRVSLCLGWGALFALVPCLYWALFSLYWPIKVACYAAVRYLLGQWAAWLRTPAGRPPRRLYGCVTAAPLLLFGAVSRWSIRYPLGVAQGVAASLELLEADLTFRAARTPRVRWAFRIGLDRLSLYAWAYFSLVAIDAALALLAATARALACLSRQLWRVGPPIAGRAARLGAQALSAAIHLSWAVSWAIIRRLRAPVGWVAARALILVYKLALVLLWVAIRLAGAVRRRALVPLYRKSEPLRSKVWAPVHRHREHWAIIEPFLCLLWVLWRLRPELFSLGSLLAHWATQLRFHSQRLWSFWADRLLCALCRLWCSLEDAYLQGVVGAYIDKGLWWALTCVAALALVACRAAGRALFRLSLRVLFWLLKAALRLPLSLLCLWYRYRRLRRRIRRMEMAYEKARARFQKKLRRFPRQFRRWRIRMYKKLREQAREARRFLRHVRVCIRWGRWIPYRPLWKFTWKQIKQDLRELAQYLAHEIPILVCHYGPILWMAVKTTLRATFYISRFALKRGWWRVRYRYHCRGGWPGYRGRHLWRLILGRPTVGPWIRYAVQNYYYMRARRRARWLRVYFPRRILLSNAGAVGWQTCHALWHDFWRRPWDYPPRPLRHLELMAFVPPPQTFFFVWRTPQWRRRARQFKWALVDALKFGWRELWGVPLWAIKEAIGAAGISVCETRPNNRRRSYDLACALLRRGSALYSPQRDHWLRYQPGPIMQVLLGASWWPERGLSWEAPYLRGLTPSYSAYPFQVTFRRLPGACVVGSFNRLVVIWTNVWWAIRPPFVLFGNPAWRYFCRAYAYYDQRAIAGLLHCYAEGFGWLFRRTAPHPASLVALALPIPTIWGARITVWRRRLPWYQEAQRRPRQLRRLGAVLLLVALPTVFFTTWWGFLQCPPRGLMGALRWARRLVAPNPSPLGLYLRGWRRATARMRAVACCLWQHRFGAGGSLIPFVPSTLSNPPLSRLPFPRPGWAHAFPNSQEPFARVGPNLANLVPSFIFWGRSYVSTWGEPPLASRFFGQPGRPRIRPAKNPMWRPLVRPLLKSPWRDGWYPFSRIPWAYIPPLKTARGLYGPNTLGLTPSYNILYSALIGVYHHWYRFFYFSLWRPAWVSLTATFRVHVWFFGELDRRKFLYWFTWNNTLPAQRYPLKGSWWLFRERGGFLNVPLSPLRALQQGLRLLRVGLFAHRWQAALHPMLCHLTWKWALPLITLWAGWLPPFLPPIETPLRPAYGLAAAGSLLARLCALPRWAMCGLLQPPQTTTLCFEALDQPPLPRLSSLVLPMEPTVIPGDPGTSLGLGTSVGNARIYGYKFKWATKGDMGLMPQGAIGPDGRLRHPLNREPLHGTPLEQVLGTEWGSGPTGGFVDPALFLNPAVLTYERPRFRLESPRGPQGASTPRWWHPIDVSLQHRPRPLLDYVHRPLRDSFFTPTRFSAKPPYSGGSRIPTPPNPADRMCAALDAMRGALAPPRPMAGRAAPEGGFGGRLAALPTDLPTDGYTAMPPRALYPYHATPMEDPALWSHGIDERRHFITIRSAEERLVTAYRPTPYPCPVEKRPTLEIAPPKEPPYMSPFESYPTFTVGIPPRYRYVSGRNLFKWEWPYRYPYNDLSCFEEPTKAPPIKLSPRMAERAARWAKWSRWQDFWARLPRPWLRSRYGEWPGYILEPHDWGLALEPRPRRAWARKGQPARPVGNWAEDEWGVRLFPHEQAHLRHRPILAPWPKAQTVKVLRRSEDLYCDPAFTQKLHRALGVRPHIELHPALSGYWTRAGLKPPHLQDTWARTSFPPSLGHNALASFFADFWLFVEATTTAAWKLVAETLSPWGAGYHLVGLLRAWCSLPFTCGEALVGRFCRAYTHRGPRYKTPLPEFFNAPPYGFYEWFELMDEGPARVGALASTLLALWQLARWALPKATEWGLWWVLQPRSVTTMSSLYYTSANAVGRCFLNNHWSPSPNPCLMATWHVPGVAPLRTDLRFHGSSSSNTSLPISRVRSYAYYHATALLVPWLASLVRRFDLYVVPLIGVPGLPLFNELGRHRRFRELVDSVKPMWDPLERTIKETRMRIYFPARNHFLIPTWFLQIIFPWILWFNLRSYPLIYRPRRWIVFTTPRGWAPYRHSFCEEAGHTSVIGDLRFGETTPFRPCFGFNFTWLGFLNPGRFYLPPFWPYDTVAGARRAPFTSADTRDGWLYPLPKEGLYADSSVPYFVWLMWTFLRAPTRMVRYYYPLGMSYVFWWNEKVADFFARIDPDARELFGELWYWPGFILQTIFCCPWPYYGPRFIPYLYIGDGKEFDWWKIPEYMIPYMKRFYEHFIDGSWPTYPTEVYKGKLNWLGDYVDSEIAYDSACTFIMFPWDVPRITLNDISWYKWLFIKAY